ncbi:MAG: hypothetical protein E2O88_11080 [Bacteroidetes bacterium]|nr:MAG: hypothetical protein E2O88_11080 [Bacteroidota bacterium]
MEDQSQHKPPSFKYIEIPKEFHSYSKGGLFERCIMCDRNLLESGEHYMIEKAIKSYPDYSAKDVIFEYAICISCAMKMRNELSSETLSRIDQYMARNIDLSSRKHLMEQEEINIENWLGNCLITGKSKDELEEYQLYAHCFGDKMVCSEMPYMISGQVLYEVGELLSKQSQDELDGFKDQYFGLPPELKDLIGPKDVILL